MKNLELFEKSTGEIVLFGECIFIEGIEAENNLNFTLLIRNKIKRKKDKVAKVFIKFGKNLKMYAYSHLYIEANELRKLFDLFHSKIIQ